MEFPDTITHYHDAADAPFRSLSDLDDQALDGVLERLKMRKVRNSAYQRVFGANYMALRHRTEAKLRDLFVERGGRPDRKAPHYFVLGTCPWFAALYPNPKTIALDWRSLPRDQVSFTYPDSFVAMRLGPKFGMPPGPRRPYHEKVFLLDELAKIVADYGLPDGGVDVDYSTYHTREFAKYIEVQVWSDAPVAAYLRR